MNSMNWYNTWWANWPLDHLTTWPLDHLTMWARYCEPHMDSLNWYGIWWDTRPRGQYIVSHTWTAWTDTIHGEPHGQYKLIRHMVSHLTTWTVWIDTAYGEPLYHTDSHVSNILWATRPRDQYIVSHIWTAWTDTIYGEPLDHVDSMNRYNIWWATWPREQYMVRHMTT